MNKKMLIVDDEDDILFNYIDNMIDEDNII